jgi:hypothetical protein
MAKGRASSVVAGGVASGEGFLPADLVPGIAQHLEDEGEYRITVDARSPQQLVDVRWAALSAGRLLGRPVQVITTKAVSSNKGPILMKVTWASAQRSAQQSAQRRTIPRQRQQQR